VEEARLGGARMDRINAHRPQAFQADSYSLTHENGKQPTATDGLSRAVLSQRSIGFSHVEAASPRE